MLNITITFYKPIVTIQCCYITYGTVKPYVYISYMTPRQHLWVLKIKTSQGIVLLSIALFFTTQLQVLN